MFNRKIIYITLATLFVLSIILVFIILQINDKKLKVVFFDVGQGDSILITQGSQQVLIDGGKDGMLLLNKLGKYVPFWDRSIELVSASHPDQDHIGGLVELFKTYSVKDVLKTKSESDSQVYKTLQTEIDKEKSEIIEAKKNVRILFPGGAILSVLYPFDSLQKIIDQKTNEHSIVLRLENSGESFLFTGDLPITQEEEFLAKEIDLKTDVLKVAHHGSKYSTGDNFLNDVSPRDAIISVGKNNTYGHPNQETLQKLLQHKVKIFRTDEIGDIIYECKKGKCARSLD